MFCSFITASFFLKIRVKDEITAKHSTQSGYMQSIVCFDTLLPICRCGLLCSCSEKESPGQVHSQWRHCVLKLSCCAAVSWNVSRQYTKGMCRQQRERGCRRSRSIILPGVINKCLPKLDTVEWDHWWETSNKRGEDQYTIRLFPPFIAWTDDQTSLEQCAVHTDVCCDWESQLSSVETALTDRR